MTSAARLGGPHMRGRLRDEYVVERTLPVTPTSAHVARATAQLACRGWRISSVCEDVVLAVSELVGNAVRHGGGGRVRLRLSMTPRRLRLEVADAAAGTPTLRMPPADAEGGRGLWLVSSVATRWGVDAEPAGKRVWVEIAL